MTEKNTEFPKPDIRFDVALSSASAELEREGIGRLSEKLLHRTLKYYLEPDNSHHEIPTLGSVADIRREGEIIEIQTRSLDKLAPKLERFLPEYRVSVVYPVITKRTIVWCDPESGEAVSESSSSKRQKFSDAISELSKLSSFIGRENLSFLLIEMTAHEYRVLDGYGKDKKKRAGRIDTVPDSIGSSYAVTDLSSFAALLPNTLPDEFTRKELFRALHLRGIGGSVTQRALIRMGIIKEHSKRGRAIIYKRGEIS